MDQNMYTVTLSSFIYKIHKTLCLLKKADRFSDCQTFRDFPY